MSAVRTDEYYFMVSLNGVAALATLVSVLYEIRQPVRRRWYIGTNIMAAIIQIVSISFVTVDKNNGILSYDILHVTLLLLSQLLILLLIKQSLTILKCFSILNDYGCQIVDKHAQ